MFSSTYFIFSEKSLSLLLNTPLTMLYSKGSTYLSKNSCIIRFILPYMNSLINGFSLSIIDVTCFLSSSESVEEESVSMRLNL